MAAAIVFNQPLAAGEPAVAQPASARPIHFFYGHLHNSIRKELDCLSKVVVKLELDTEDGLVTRLRHLKARYQFLEQIYKYHSSVEDEVCNC